MAAEAFLAASAGARPRAAALGKAVLFLILALLGALLATAVAKGLSGASLLDLARGGAATGAARAILLLLGVVVLPTAVMLRMVMDPLRVSGWAADGAGRLLGLPRHRLRPARRDRRSVVDRRRGGVRRRGAQPDGRRPRGRSQPARRAALFVLWGGIVRAAGGMRG